MASYKILADSACDIQEGLLQEYNIELVPFFVSFDQNKYYKERVEITNSEFYKVLRTENVFPKTSLPSVQDYIDKFTVYLNQGLDILCFCLAQNFSGSYQSAVNAKNILTEDYPNRKIEVVDSRQATSGQGLIVLEAARMQKAGFSIEALIEKIELVKVNSRIVFTIDSLEYLQKGGRIGKVSSLLGSFLNIKPIIVMRNDELSPAGKVRGRKKAILELYSVMEQEMGDNKNFDDYNFMIINSDALEEATAFRDTLKNEFNLNTSYPISDLGVTIGAHTGPTVVGICFVRKYETL